MTVRYPWNKTDSTPSFTGIPPHVGILAQLEGLKLELKMMTETILGGVKADLDACRMGSQ